MPQKDHVVRRDTFPFCRLSTVYVTSSNYKFDQNAIDFQI